MCLKSTQQQPGWVRGWLRDVSLSLAQGTSSALVLLAEMSSELSDFENTQKAQMAPKKADFPSHPLSFCQIHEIRRKRETKIRDPQWEKLSQHLCRIFYMVSLWITHHHCRNSLYSSGLWSQCSGFHMDLSCMQLKGIFSVLYAFCIFICYLWKY